MMEKYEPQKIESKWQKRWDKEELYKAEDFSDKPKQYILIEFPYPSGEGLHVGHLRPYSALDAVARKKRMEGYNVLFPMGWDAFGLPAENYAIKTGVHPQKTTAQNIANYKRQMKSLGLSFDWTRQINTTDPEYYKWTQWIFLQLFKKGLAYQAEIPINWCPSCKIGLANEEVVSGKCERCGTQVERKIKKQWMLKITKYADRLINDLEEVNYLEKIKAQQINWIGRSEGVGVEFRIENTEYRINVFTTRLDTIFGVTAVVLAPEHKLVEKLVTGDNKEKVNKYIEQTKRKSDFERTELKKEKTGVFTGSYCLNPVNKEKVPIWVGDYVVATYGGGAVMVVPAHDKRDFNFAKKYGLEIREVIIPQNQKSKIKNKNLAFGKNLDSSGIQNDNSKIKVLDKSFVDDGMLINSGQFSGLTSEKGREEITKWLEKKGLARKTVQYKLRDWVFSRQHYWGEPIPLVFCDNCRKKLMGIFNFQFSIFKKNPKSKIQNLKSNFSQGELLNPGWVAVQEKDLPVELPYVEKYQPTGTGESPLAKITDWVDVKCPKCKEPAKRETDTMPNWAGSSWYYLAYTMRGGKNTKHKTKKYNQEVEDKEIIWDKEKIRYWMPVDWYNGGMEHTTLHLLYSRFWHKFLFDIGAVSQAEPYTRRTSHGIVLAEDGRKMSKSFGNVVNPDDIIKEYGADTLRVYEMFMGPFDQAIAWSTQGVKGVYRFLEKVWRLSLECAENPEGEQVHYGAGEKSSPKIIRAIHQLNKKIDEDLEATKFNTIIAGFMQFVNFGLENKKEVGKDTIEKMLLLLSPFSPHISEELWQRLGHKESIFKEKWPKYDSKLVREKKITLVIQINGKVRDKIEVETDISEGEAKKLTLEREKIKKWTKGKTIRRTIFVSGKLINIVI